MSEFKDYWKKGVDFLRDKTRCQGGLIAEIIYTFTMGVIFSSFQRGLFYLVIFMLILELFYLILHWGRPYVTITYRGGLLMTSLLGYIVGREVLGYEILYVGDVPFIKDWPQKRHIRKSNTQEEKNEFRAYIKKERKRYEAR